MNFVCSEPNANITQPPRRGLVASGSASSMCLPAFSPLRLSVRPLSASSHIAAASSLSGFSCLARLPYSGSTLGDASAEIYAAAETEPPRATPMTKPATPNHALQRTGAAVTPAASSLRLSPATQRSRQPRPSLSLGSLGPTTGAFSESELHIYE